AWLATGDPAALWPALEPGTLQPAADAIGRAVAAILRDERATLGAADGRDAYAIGIAALLSGTGPLLGHWLERGALDASEPVAAVLARHLEQGRRRMERITAGVRPALAALHAAGLAPVVVKGFHTAHAYFPEPGARPIADVDVLVAPGDVARAETALRDVDFRASDLVATPYKRDWYPPDDDGRTRSFELWHARDRWKLELHDGLNFEHTRPYDVRLGAPTGVDDTFRAVGVPVRVAGQPLLVSLLATHLSGELYSSRLLRLIELVLVVRRDDARGLLDWAAVTELLERSGAVRFTYPAFALVERLAPGTIDAALVARARATATPRTRRIADGLTPTAPAVQARVSLAERLMWTTGPLDTMRRLALMALPVPGRPWRDSLLVYHGRVRRLLAGRVSWQVPPDGRAPRADAPGHDSHA
ncbi:MAG TPA: nucleotidyltransferase family protein, partial [Gemmatimonadaceae bacterium]|nr:nucleotidyltransferase family protein [Gemmatimonadaceae bacterium]